MLNSVGVIGSGVVGRVLAAGFARHGASVLIGTREPAKLAEFATSSGVGVGSFADAADRALVVVAVGGAVALDALSLAGHGRLAGKVVIDTMNPIAGPPSNGVIPYFTGPGESLLERLQAAVPAARFVKAFNSVGNAWMVNPSFPGGRPTMFICGDDPAAKAEVAGWLATFGHDPEDMGGAAAARFIEPLCQLWCARGFQGRGWNHAFALLKG
jgi:predicted dinucleotide-binding enzyme